MGFSFQLHWFFEEERERVMDEEDVDATLGNTGHHVAKRYRKNKFAVAVFDEKARQYAATSFPCSLVR